MYADNVFIREGQNTWFRIQIGHDCEAATFASEGSSRKFAEQGLLLKYEPVQAQKIVCYGWLLGSVPDSANADDMKQTHENHPALKGLQGEIRAEEIK